MAASAALAAGLSPLLPAASAAEVPQETVVPATLRSSHTQAVLRGTSTHTGHDGAGVQGVFHTLEGTGGLLWTRYADGRSVRVPTAGTAPMTTGTDVLAYPYSDGRVDFWDATDGTTRSLRIPEGLSRLTSYDNLTVAYRNVAAEDGTTTRVVHLLTPSPDGATGDLTVTGGPAGIKLGLIAGGDATMVYFLASVDGQVGLAAVDRASGEVRGWSGPLPVGYRHVDVGGGHAVVSAYDKATVLVFPRDLSAAPAELALKGFSDGVNATHDLAVVGDWLVNGTGVVTAQPIAGGEPVTLLRSSEYGIAAGPGGTAVKIGRTGTDDWGVQRITPGADGGPPVVTLVKALPKPPRPIQGLSLEQGRLVVLDYPGVDVREDNVRTVAPSGTPVFGERGEFTPGLPIAACATTDVACAQVHGTADGRMAWLLHDETTDRIRVGGRGNSDIWQRTGLPRGGRITDVSGRYLIHTTATQQIVLEIGNSTPVLTRTPAPAALTGDTLWTAAATPGTVTAYNLTARRTTETLTTDAGCTPTELQALGRYLYWSCADGEAGVYDRTAKQSVPVPGGEAKLGDGYVVTHDKQAGKLTLTTVADGTPHSRVIGDLPDTGVSQRDVRWTVDEAGANAAYVDDQERVHLVPSGVAQQPLRLLGPVRKASHVEAREFDTTPDTLATVLLSKPSSGWDLTVRHRATGKVYGDGEDGGPARGELSVGWNGLDPKVAGSAFLPNGVYDWTLTVTPADGVGGPLQVRGSVQLLNGSPVRHDHVGSEGMPDGAADLLTLNSSGTLTFQQGTGKGTFSGKVSGGGWSTSVVAVPFGDLNNDRCNDVLVRMSDGSLRGYKVKCGLAPTPSMPYTKLGTGWNAYDVLTSPGDLTGDKRADLLARKASTGDVYLFAAKSDGTLAAGKRIRSAWTGYTKVVGAGDLNGDGHGDVLARDRAGVLWRYDGLGNGLLKERVKVFSGWGSGYDVVVGAGDITGDGKADLVSRDGSGTVWRNNGDGKGSFGARVKIASGWQGYKGIF
ncbi:FG-GAP repeat domain-containing protein [Streptomyces sp. NPDC049627]|uniref:FG-GAP repeat domain-containing protein n=1 Tax=Streptomyces sp. NPDC049627 TaxID=3365595 RepID=UPI0037B6CF56